MRILHAVTLIDSCNSYGGPTTVALSQASEMARRGHSVTVVAVSDTRSEISPSPHRLSIKTFRGRVLLSRVKHSSLFSARLVLWALANVRRYEIVHIHLAREFVPLVVGLACLARKVPYVTQTHGMVTPDDRIAIKLIDLLITRRILRGALARFALTTLESSALEKVEPTGAAPQLLLNGIAAIQSEAKVLNFQGPIVFIARLHPRKRLNYFLSLVESICSLRPYEKFLVAGPDAGSLNILKEFLRKSDYADSVDYLGALSPAGVRSALSQAKLLVLPSVDEPYPMIVLESLALGTPVVVTDSCGLADFVVTHECGVVVEPNMDDLESRVLRLLNDEKALHEMGLHGRQAVMQELSIDHIIDAWERAVDQTSCTQSNRYNPRRLGLTRRTSLE